MQVTPTSCNCERETFWMLRKRSAQETPRNSVSDASSRSCRAGQVLQQACVMLQ